MDQSSLPEKEENKTIYKESGIIRHLHKRYRSGEQEYNSVSQMTIFAILSMFSVWPSR
jgi:hypothetical protein